MDVEYGIHDCRFGGNWSKSSVNWEKFYCEPFAVSKYAEGYVCSL